MSRSALFIWLWKSLQRAQEALAQVKESSVQAMFEQTTQSIIFRGLAVHQG